MTIWEELSDENEFCDVTLVCENKQISDHKLVFCFDHAVFKPIMEAEKGFLKKDILKSMSMSLVLLKLKLLQELFLKIYFVIIF